METEIKTSKIKEVVSTKDYKNNYGVTIYHKLVMENGDKIEIGKKSIQKVGWELTYEITDPLFEYNKAQSSQKQELAQVNGVAKTYITNSNDNDLKQRMIIAQSSLSSAVEFYKGQTLDVADTLACAKKFYDWVINTSK